MTTEEIKTFLEKAKVLGISLNHIEREAGIPKKTLSHFLNNRRGINETHVEKLTTVIERIKMEIA